MSAPHICAAAVLLESKYFKAGINTLVGWLSLETDSKLIFFCRESEKQARSISLLKVDTQVCRLEQERGKSHCAKNRMFSFLLSTFGFIAANNISEDKSIG